MHEMKTETKDLGMETHPGEGVVNKETFPHNRKPSHRCVCEDLWNLRRQHNWGAGGGAGETHRIHTKPQLPVEKWPRDCASAQQQVGLGKEVQAASSVPRVRTELECLEDNLRELK